MKATANCERSRQRVLDHYGAVEAVGRPRAAAPQLNASVDMDFMMKIVAMRIAQGRWCR